MEKVNYKYSQSEMVAYLISKGYNYSSIDVKENNRYKGKYKVFFNFEGFKDDFIQFEKEFNSETNICLKNYIDILFNVKNIIHNSISNVK